MAELTKGAITDIHHEVKVDKPKLQVLSIKKIASNNADPKKPERYRMQLSDGEKKQPSSMLATQLNHLIIDNEIQENGIIQLDRYISNTVNDHRIIIILGVTVVSGPTDLIGNPTPVGKDEPAAAAAVPKAEPTRAKMISPQASSNNPYSNSRSSSANVAPRGGRSSMAGNIQPINTLTPYQGSRWTIQVRVTNKTERTYSNARGEGKLFNVDMCDASGEMRGTGFNQDADRLGAIFETGKCYTVSGGKLKQANPRFNPLNGDYEVTFGSETKVEVVEDESSVPKQKFNYAAFDTCEGVVTSAGENGAFVDVLGVIISVGDLTSITTKKDQRELSKRELDLQDKSNIVLRCTLWGKQAEAFDAEAGTIMSIKSAKLSDFNGCSMSVSMNSTFELNIDHDEAHELRAWYESEGKTATVTRMQRSGGGGGPSRRIMLHQIKDEGIGQEEGKKEYFETKATVTFVRKSDKMMYKACPTDGCNKKLIEESSNEFRCEKCSKSFDNFNWRMIPGFSVSDATGQAWVSSFSEVAEVIFGTKVQQMGDLMESNEAEFTRIINKAFFQDFMWKIQARSDTYNEETRVKCVAMSVAPVNPVKESRYLIDEIKKYAAREA